MGMPGDLIRGDDPAYMANIMLTSVCNLHCPYCFANEYVHQSSSEISTDHFLKAKEFILGDGTERCIGLIGGEPTTHSRFEDLLRMTIEDSRVQIVSVYTNAVFLDRFFHLVSHPKVRMLINCNSPSDMGMTSFMRMRDNLDEMIFRRLARERITLGVNLYKPAFEYDFIMELLKRYQYSHVRISVAVPNLPDQRDCDPRDHFTACLPGLRLFLKELIREGIVPSFDCNKIPQCVFSKEDLDEFAREARTAYEKGKLKRKISISGKVNCSPVVDITQDLVAVRCFGLSQYTKVPISQFACISDLKQYYLRTIDSFACNTVFSQDCVNCYERLTGHCYGGCLAYKIHAIQQMQNVSGQMMGNHDVV